MFFFSIVLIRFAGSLKAGSTSLRENSKFLLLIIDGLKIVLRNADVFRSILILLVGMQLFFLRPNSEISGVIICFTGITRTIYY